MIVRACLFKRHDSRDQDVRDLGTFNSQLPASVTGKISMSRTGWLATQS
jgi:hypothetical protein